MSSKKFVKLLAHGGARFVRQRGTSHAIFEREKDGRLYRAPVVMAKRELTPNEIHETGISSVRLYRRGD